MGPDAFVSLARIVAIGLLGSVLAGPGAAGADAGRLRERFEALRTQPAGLPEGLHVMSDADDRQVQAEVLGVLAHPFAAVSKLLESPTRWCDVVLLHLNTKACVHGVQGDQLRLRLYTGRKYYQPPDEAFPLDYRFERMTVGEGYLAVQLHAAEGPMGTRDHTILVEAALVGEATALRFSCSYRPSTLSRWATGAYLATLGRNKTGLSTVTRNVGEDPVPSAGLRGIVERNALRYYLALRATLDSDGAPQADSFEARLAAWFDLAAQYPALDELSREMYLEGKRRERANQRALQRSVDAAQGELPH